ncbi:MAG: DUF116 domain-containing protein [Candidatus Abyssobacteria bacterium SURF_5]|uniref:DUF116 domain-containing protein n=1 Tax=Abyssobacteria bacterium (strain SURF_5) TaxID=2093360 RepID=A0A3A4NTG3_ABYX5|nr:MAG: DUF116 domain-containing protein [Candidatus Abyssubacteria bacterium SURF_5]
MKRTVSTDATAPKRSMIMNVVYPVYRAAGRLFGISGDSIDDFFIEKNNRLILQSRKKYPPQKMLLLFPHCLQDWECPHRINADIHNCHACGKCKIPELVRIGDRYKVPMRVVGGGSAARRAIIDTRPDFVLAVACERDMISGIRDSLPLPVLGILNERPNGPCKNTTVDVERVERTLALLVETNSGLSPTSEED